MQSVIIAAFAGLSLLPVAAEGFKPADHQQFTVQTVLPLTVQMQQLLQQAQQHPTDESKLAVARQYLSGARQPGFDDWFYQAEQVLDTISVEGKKRQDYLLLMADIQQQQHQFAAALRTLESVFITEPHHINASLMAARIYLAQHQPDAAQRSCNQLWQQDLFLFSVCSYEVAGRKGEWGKSYAALTRLWQREQPLPAELDIWLRGILAEQAEQLNMPDTARQWLTPVLQSAPTSLWLKWADLSLAAAADEEVYQQLAAQHQTIGLSDGLLLRLVLAAQTLNKTGQYSVELEQRIALRLARKDTDHAADLAHYFLRVKPDPQAALHWARLNFQTAKEPDDVRLLQLSTEAHSLNVRTH